MKYRKSESGGEATKIGTQPAEEIRIEGGRVRALVHTGHASNLYAGSTASFTCVLVQKRP